MSHQRIATVGAYRPLHITTAGTAVVVGWNVATTSTTTIVAGTNVVVTPASLVNIITGLVLNVANGTGATEDVVVKSVNPVAGTFTADFVNSHSGAYTLISKRATNVGRIVVNNPGSGCTLTLYNGHPSLLPSGQSQVTGILNPDQAPVFEYEGIWDKGLVYTLTVGGTNPDLTLLYVDM